MSEKTVKASARKTKLGYKPIIVFPDGKTRVVEQSPERCGVYTKHGFIKGNKYATGNVYEIREEAIEAAQREIEHQLSIQIAAREKHKKQCSPAQWEKSHHGYDHMVLLYGGTL